MYWLDCLQAEGINSTVLTCRWHPSWPDDFELRGTRVCRLQPPANTNWNESYFQRNVLNWLQANLSDVGWIYVDRIDSLASVLLSKSNRLEKPILLRAGAFDSCVGLAPNARCPLPMQIDIARQAETVIVPSASMNKSMLQYGVSASNLVCIDDLVPLPVSRDSEQQKLSLHALAKINSDFVHPEQTPLIVHFGHSQWGPLKETLQAICDLLDSGALIRMWIVNPGLPYDRIYEFLKDRGWHREILMFDSFDDIEALLSVADLVWFSNPEEALQYTLPATISSGIPFLVKEHTDLEPAFGPGVLDCIYDSPTNLALQLHRWYAHPSAVARRVKTLQAELDARRSTSHLIKQWRSALDRRRGADGRET